MHSEAISPKSTEQQGSPFYAALARTTTRAIALYFSRPVRLFRPSKVSGWHSLRGHANKHGTTLSPQYILSLVKDQGVFMVIPKHFLPPILANAILGTVLWTTYAECSNCLRSQFGVYSMFTVALSGAAAGGMQALVAAPVENVRLVIEGGTGKGWSHAWKEVFRRTQPAHATAKADQIRDARQVRLWMKDVGDMAGRGWAGWGWGFGKDVCGFAAFFTVFEITREVAKKVKLATHHTLQILSSYEEPRSSNLPRFAHALTLVCGGVMAGLTYEIVCRPWDVARRAITLHGTRVPRSDGWQQSFSVLTQKLKADGITSFVQDRSIGLHEHPKLQSNVYRRISSAVRTLARVGPWGVGFLVWESLSAGLD